MVSTSIEVPNFSPIRSRIDIIVKEPIAGRRGFYNNIFCNETLGLVDIVIKKSYMAGNMLSRFGKAGNFKKSSAHPSAMNSYPKFV